MKTKMIGFSVLIGFMLALLGSSPQQGQQEEGLETGPIWHESNEERNFGALRHMMHSIDDCGGAVVTSMAYNDDVIAVSYECDGGKIQVELFSADGKPVGGKINVGNKRPMRHRLHASPNKKHPFILAGTVRHGYCSEGYDCHTQSMLIEKNSQHGKLHNLDGPKISAAGLSLISNGELLILYSPNEDEMAREIWAYDIAHELGRSRIVLLEESMKHRVGIMRGAHDRHGNLATVYGSNSDTSIRLHFGDISGIKDDAPASENILEGAKIAGYINYIRTPVIRIGEITAVLYEKENTIFLGGFDQNRLQVWKVAIDSSTDESDALVTASGDPSDGVYVYVLKRNGRTAVMKISADGVMTHGPKRIMDGSSGAIVALPGGNAWVCGGSHQAGHVLCTAVGDM